MALACKAIARRVAYGALSDVIGAAGSRNAQGEDQLKLDLLANEIFLHANEWGARGRDGIVGDGGHLHAPGPLSARQVSPGLRPGEDARREAFLQAGTAQVCAGYASYGPCTMLVITSGKGTHAFTLDPQLGEWVLSHPNLRIPVHTQEFALNASSSRFTSNPLIARTIPTADESFVVIRFADPRGFDFSYLLSMRHDAWMTRADTIACPGGKMDLAIQLIFTPMVMRLAERRRKLLAGERAPGRAVTGRRWPGRVSALARRPTSRAVEREGPGCTARAPGSATPPPLPSPSR